MGTNDAPCPHLHPENCSWVPELLGISLLYSGLGHASNAAANVKAAVRPGLARVHNTAKVCCASLRELSAAEHRKPCLRCPAGKDAIALFGERLSNFRPRRECQMSLGRESMYIHIAREITGGRHPRRG